MIIKLAKLHDDPSRERRDKRAQGTFRLFIEEVVNKHQALLFQNEF
ncbi:MAG: hypothetical protein OXD01_10690 [Gammaproteobacteria bacterium]|nr:hypothetical protein [Gammaproteobacteria bacterium]